MEPTPGYAQRDPDLVGARVLVVGLGVSGLAAIRLALGRGAEITATDTRTEEALGAAAAEARAAGARLRLGSNPAELADEAELVVVSPGVPPDSPLLARARARRIPIWGEIELAARFARGRIVAVTGSNGKSTVTTMVGRILRTAGIPGGTGGNLAIPFADLLSLDAPEAWHALELSSFQLETALSLRADVAVVLNLSPDHLDRHGSVEAYGKAKARLLELQTPQGAAVLNADDPPLDFMRAIAGSRLHEFSTRRAVARGAFCRDGRIVLRTDAGEELALPLERIPVPGEHNLSNALAAACACRLAGCPIEAIDEGLASFVPLPHRLQRVAEIRGVGFYDDSKATNPASAARAVEAFAPHSVFLILGGRDKRSDWSELVTPVRERVRRLLLVGEAAEMLAERFRGVAPISRPGSVGAAVAEGFAAAGPGDVVLLAPGCASFDQYRNFAERGLDFHRAVLELAHREGDAVDG